MSRPRASILAVALVTTGIGVAAAATQSPRPSPTATPTADDLVPGAQTRAAAWYCAAGGGGVPGGSAAETVMIVNAGRVPVTTNVTPIAGREPLPFRRVDVAPRTRAAVKVGDIPGANEAGVIVETFGGDVAVEHELESGRDFAAGPCTRTASTRWYFAAGSTVRDAREVIALLNPFADDAVIDFSFVTDDGVKRPPALRGFVVPARGRVNVVVNDHVPRQEHVATSITSRRGRIVAERTFSFDGTNGRSGYAATLGQREPQRTLRFAEGQIIDGVAESIVIFNPSDDDADVSVRVELDGDQAVAPHDVAVPALSTVAVDLGPLLPRGPGHAIVVQSDRPVVAEQLLFSRPPAPRTGFEAVGPAPEASKQWLFASGRADFSRDEWLTLWNETNRRVTVRIRVIAAGQLLAPEKLEAVMVEPHARLAVRLGDSLQRADTPVLVSSNGPVTVTRGEYGEGFSYSYGVAFPPDPAKKGRRDR